MSEQFAIRVEAHFEAAHNLRSYKGNPEPLHGHSRKVAATYTCSALDQEDIGLDYVEVQTALGQLAAQLDHSYINDAPPFRKINPTSENIARWFYHELKKKIRSTNATLAKVTVWEGPHASVSYCQKE